MLAKAMASQCPNMFFMEMSSESISTKWNGQADTAVSQIFEIARLNAPTIIFMDEIDGILTNRDDEKSYCTAVVQTMLTKLNSHPNVFLIAATNAPWNIDKAFYRRLPPVYVGLPTPEERREALRRILLKKETLLQERHMDYMVNNTEGFSFDDLRNLIEVAATASQKKALKYNFFKMTNDTDNEEPQVCACREDDPRAFTCNPVDLQGQEITLISTPILPNDIINTISNQVYTASSNKESIDRFLEFKKSKNSALALPNLVKKSGMTEGGLIGRTANRPLCG